jgi:thiamine biosynthesis lipoprotein
MSLPLADPEFWLVTAGAAVALGFALRRVLRSARADAEMPCDKCPKPEAFGPPKSGGGANRGRGVTALALALLGGAASLDAATVERQVAVMGTTMRVELKESGPRAHGLELAEAMVREVEATESRLSTWRDDSELAALNRAPAGEWMRLSSATFEAIAGAWRCLRTGEGFFDPTVSPLVRAWGLRSGGRVPNEEELRGALARVGGDRLELDAARRSVRKLAPVEIEEGAFGKGAALDAALDALAALAAGEEPRFARLDLGGQIAWSGAGRRQVVELADPRDRARPVLELELDGVRGSLSTSGDSERSVEAGGERFGHLLDPRSGRPAPDFGSATVLAPRGLDADCLSTALFVMGPERGARWLARQEPALDAVLLIVDGARLRARVTPELRHRVRALVADLEIEVVQGSS